MANLSDFTQSELKEILYYDPETGGFWWRERPTSSFETERKIRNWWNARFAGAVAGSLHQDGYYRLKINGRSFLSHRVAWLYVYGSMPKNDLMIDHINGDPSDNRISNLRPASAAENAANQVRRINNTSGYKGVVRLRGKWVAQITANGQGRHIGVFATKEEAYAAYCAAAQQLHGEFARLG